jgi:hypothetical protein
MMVPPSQLIFVRERRRTIRAEVRWGRRMSGWTNGPEMAGLGEREASSHAFG